MSAGVEMLVVLMLLGPGRVAADWLLRLAGAGWRARAARPAGIAP